MNQSIRDNPNKMMPVPYNLSETHQGFPTSSPCSSQDFDSKILSGQKLRLPNPFGCPGLFSLCNDTWCCKEAQTGYPALPGDALNVWTALIYRYPGILTSPSGTSTTRSGSVSWKNDQGMMKLCARYIPILRCHRSAEVSCLWTPIAA